MNSLHRAKCPLGLAVREAGEAMGEAVQEAFNGAMTIAAEHGVHENPLGVVLIVYCRECDCTHATHFEPDGPLGSSVSRAANACRVASTTVRIASGEQYEQTDSEKAGTN